MGEELNVEGLLHLNALALVIAIAYLGLDRVHLEKNAFLEALKEAQKKARAFLLRYAIKPGETPDTESGFYRFPFRVKLKFYAVCLIADVHRDIGMGGPMRAAHWGHRQWHVPLFGYFNKARDRKWISVLAGLLLLQFLFVTASAIWDIKHFPADWQWTTFGYLISLQWIAASHLMTPAYWLCAFVLFWIFFTVGVTHFLQHIDSIGMKLQAAIDTHLKKLTGDVTSYQLNNVPPASTTTTGQAPGGTT